MKGSTIALIALAAGAFWFWQEKKKQDAAALAVDQSKTVQQSVSQPAIAAAQPAATANITESVNPALSALPPWTDNPTPGEIELQRDLAAATAAGQNLSPVLQSAFGPAWDLMVVTPEQLASLPETIKQYYTTDGLARVRQMREYWMANHPGEPVPDFLTDEYYYRSLPATISPGQTSVQIQNLVTGQVTEQPSITGLYVPSTETTTPTAEQVLVQSEIAHQQAEKAAAEAEAAARTEAQHKAQEEAARAQEMAYAWAAQQAAQLAQQQADSAQPPQVAQSAAQQVAAQQPEVYYTPGYNPAYDPNLAFMAGAMFPF